MQFLTELEQKLLRLALDGGAQQGEIDNSAITLIRKLRNRGVNASDLIAQLETSIPALADGPVMAFGKHKGKPLTNIETAYLVWAISTCRNMTPNLRSAIQNELYSREVVNDV